MTGVKNVAKRFRNGEIRYEEAEATFRRTSGFEEMVIRTRKPRKKRSKKVGGTAFKFSDGRNTGIPTCVDRKFGTESFLSRRYADQLRASSGDVSETDNSNQVG